MDGKNAIHSLLTPQNCTVIFIDHQPLPGAGLLLSAPMATY